MSLTVLAKSLRQLETVRSWQLQRISPTTYTADIKVSPVLSGMIRAGKCYRCKIGRGKWWYGTDSWVVVKDALQYTDDVRKL